jgi:hypothetical protein
VSGSEPAPVIDLLHLFQTGASGGIELGTSTPQDIELMAADEDVISHAGPVPFSSWIVSTYDSELFFQGSPPRLYGLKLKTQFLTLEFSPGRPEASSIQQPESGLIKWRFGDYDWPNIADLPRAIRALLPLSSSMTLSANELKQIWISWQTGKREMSLEYALRPLEREGGLYEFDYYLAAIRLNDWQIDSDLSNEPNGPAA